MPPPRAPPTLSFGTSSSAQIPRWFQGPDQRPRHRADHVSVASPPMKSQRSAPAENAIIVQRNILRTTNVQAAACSCSSWKIKLHKLSLLCQRTWASLFIPRPGLTPPTHSTPGHHQQQHTHRLIALVDSGSTHNFLYVILLLHDLVCRALH